MWVGVRPAVVAPGTGGRHMGAVRHHGRAGGQTKPPSLGRKGKQANKQKFKLVLCYKFLSRLNIHFLCSEIGNNYKKLISNSFLLGSVPYIF
jgi:hypothetical protein